MDWIVVGGALMLVSIIGSRLMSRVDRDDVAPIIAKALLLMIGVIGTAIAVLGVLTLLGVEGPAQWVSDWMTVTEGAAS